MPRLVTTKLFKDVCNDKYGIRTQHAEDAIEHADDTSRINEEGIQIRVHRRHIAGERPYELVVIESEKRGGDRCIDFAFKATDALLEGAAKERPIRLVEALAERFGMTIAIGGRKAKFYHQEKVPVFETDPRKYLSIDNKKGHSFSPLTYLRTESMGAKLLASCVLCFCVDNKAYGKWLRKL